MNTTARSYILASVEKHLWKQINDLECLSDKIQTLDGMFAKSSSTFRQAGTLMNTHMTRGSVREHCLKMMRHISTTEVMGAKLEQEMKVDMILESPPYSSSQFKMNDIMNKLKLTHVDLMHIFESAKRSLVKQRSAHHVENSSKPRGKLNGG